MPSRRHVLQSGLALSATAALAPSLAAASTTGPLTFSRFVFDNRFAEAVRLAHWAAARGALPWETSGDMTALWCDHLKAAWDADPVAIAGVTTRDGLFVLETLAADYRMRVVYRGEHDAPQEGRVVHRLVGSEAAMAQVRAGAEQPWSAALARMMTGYAPGAAMATRVEFYTLPEDAEPRAVPLYSWIIAAPKRTGQASAKLLGSSRPRPFTT